MRLRRELPYHEPRPNGYGLAWFRAERDTLVYYPIPLNIVVRFLRRLYLVWAVWGQPTLWERMLREAWQAGALQEALYHRGYGPSGPVMAELDRIAAQTGGEGRA